MVDAGEVADSDTLTPDRTATMDAVARPLRLWLTGQRYGAITTRRTRAADGTLPENYPLGRRRVDATVRRLEQRPQYMQCSTTNLLAITLLFAMALALSRLDSLLIPIVFPFVFGPIAAYRVTQSLPSLVIGVLSSVFWSLVSVVPFGISLYFLILPLAEIDERLLTRGIFVTSTITYFLAASLTGGHIGGVVARPD